MPIRDTNRRGSMSHNVLSLTAITGAVGANKQATSEKLTPQQTKDQQVIAELTKKFDKNCNLKFCNKLISREKCLDAKYIFTNL